MKKLIFIFSISFFIFSCKKDKIKDISNLMNDCPEAYIDHSVPFDMDRFDTTAILDTMYNGGVFPSDNFIDTSYQLMDINPNNPNEFIVLVNSTIELSGLYIYHLCDNTINKVSSLTPQNISWSTNGKIYAATNGGPFLVLSPPAYTDFTEIYLDSVSGYRVESNPSGSKFILFYFNYPLTPFIKVYESSGENIASYSFPKKFLGWFDDKNILTSYEGTTYKLNIETGTESIYLEKSFESYDYQKGFFFKCVKTGGKFGQSTWSIHDKYGNSLFTHPPHTSYGSDMTPYFGGNNKLIVGMFTREFINISPSVATAIGQYVMLMDMDGTNVREVKFPVE